MLKEKVTLDDIIEFATHFGGLINSWVIFHYIMWRVIGEAMSADRKAAEEFLETLSKLVVEANYLTEAIFPILERDA